MFKARPPWIPICQGSLFALSVPATQATYQAFLQSDGLSRESARYVEAKAIADEALKGMDDMPRVAQDTVFQTRWAAAALALLWTVSSKQPYPNSFT